MWFLIAVACFVVSTVQAEDGKNYRLGPGDTIVVNVYAEPELARTVRIPENCSVELGLIGPTSLCGTTLLEASALIEARLVQGYLKHPQVFVGIEIYGSQLVEVMGAVAKRGIQALEGQTTLSQVITSAGGPSAENVVEVDVVSEGGQVTTYQLANLNAMDPLIQAGDKIILREGRHVYVHGEVESEGAVVFRKGLTVTQALALAGGPAEFAQLRKAHVLRGDGDKIVVNLRRIIGGKAVDFVLEPDDKLIVRRSSF